MEKSIKKNRRDNDPVARKSLIGIGLFLLLGSMILAWKLSTIASPHIVSPVDIGPYTIKLATQSEQIQALEKKMDSFQKSPASRDSHTLFCIQMAIITLQTQQTTAEAKLWLSRIETSDPNLQKHIDTQQKVLAEYHKPDIEPRLIKLKALIQQLRTLESRPTLATATQYEAPEAAVTLPAFLDRYLVIRRQDNARAQYWFDATEQAITTQEIVTALYVAQLALVSHQEVDYQKALIQALKPIQRLRSPDIAILAPLITALQEPLTHSILPDLYPLYEQARQLSTKPSSMTEHTNTVSSPYIPPVSEVF